MYHVKKTLADMPVTLELDKYYDWLESECSSLGSKVQFHAIVFDCLLTISFVPTLVKGQEAGEYAAEKP